MPPKKIKLIPMVPARWARTCVLAAGRMDREGLFLIMARYRLLSTFMLIIVKTNVYAQFTHPTNITNRVRNMDAHNKLVDLCNTNYYMLVHKATK